MTTYIILLFGLLILVGGGILVFKPGYIIGLITKHKEAASLHVFAVVIRAILGIVLIVGASESRYPTALLILGWLTVVAALTLSVIGRDRFKKIVDWSAKTGAAFRLTMGFLAVLFGGFLVYAVL